MKIGDLCPVPQGTFVALRGEAAVVTEAGCRKCYACGTVSVRSFHSF